MDNQPPTLTPAEVNQVKTLIDAAKAEWISAVIGGITAKQPEILVSCLILN